MKKQCIKYICIIILSILLFMIFTTKSFSATYSDSGGYTIESYDIDMVVNEDNTFDITEKITTYFNSERHRNIQRNTIKQHYNKSRWHKINKYS